MTISSTIRHSCRAILGASSSLAGLVLLNMSAGKPVATALVATGALLLLLTNPNSVPLLNKTLGLRKLPKALPLPINDITQIVYDVRHAPRPGRLT